MPRLTSHVSRLTLIAAATAVAESPAEAGVVVVICPQQANNTMRYDCTVLQSSPANPVRIGHRQDGSAHVTWFGWHAPAGTTTDTLYNFELKKRA